ncbi:hypothetical protein L4174_005460 [Photobacterium sp. CCB-ST2H9]|uniref:hypothetical protein n=1 Tax=Photobacterium sp. CCB-ST2H9 TaxID=2912855 RepID=UPI002005A81A|nr:hypothetical protein [Photobacterium sp. CCB-ST2H9]UTM58290.1 hypothetical protein L4174_005460 [Photobacterium sp. CCB-ST2H9]
MRLKYIAYQLLRPFSYLEISHKAKVVYDWYIPITLSLISLVYGYYFIGLNDIYRNNSSLILELISFVGNLPGFYIAALAAVATFNRADMDLSLPEPAPEIKTLMRGGEETIKLTRRRYLCLLFAFLTSESISLIVLSKIALSSNFNFNNDVVYWIGIGFFFLFFWQLLTATLYGLFYMGDKMHEPRP